MGNTIIDVLKERTIPHEKNEFAKDGILTLHRKQLVDDFEMLYKTLKKIDIFCGKIKKQIIFPIHPRTLKNLKKNNFKFFKLKNIKLCKPLSYLDFIKTLKYSKIVFTDSGGVQEEASFFNILCITLRSDTERQETVLENFNILVDPYRINAAVLFKNTKNLLSILLKIEENHHMIMVIPLLISLKFCKKIYLVEDMSLKLTLCVPTKIEIKI